MSPSAVSTFEMVGCEGSKPTPRSSQVKVYEPSAQAADAKVAALERAAGGQDRAELVSAACLLNGADLRPSRKAEASSETKKKLMCLADR